MFLTEFFHYAIWDIYLSITAAAWHYICTLDGVDGCLWQVNFVKFFAMIKRVGKSDRWMIRSHKTVWLLKS